MVLCAVGFDSVVGKRVLQSLLGETEVKYANSELSLRLIQKNSQTIILEPLSSSLMHISSTGLLYISIYNVCREQQIIHNFHALFASMNPFKSLQTIKVIINAPNHPKFLEIRDKVRILANEARELFITTTQQNNCTIEYIEYVENKNNLSIDLFSSDSQSPAIERNELLDKYFAQKYKLQKERATMETTIYRKRNSLSLNNDNININMNYSKYRQLLMTLLLQMKVIGNSRNKVIQDKNYTLLFPAFLDDLYTNALASLYGNIFSNQQHETKQITGVSQGSILTKDTQYSKRLFVYGQNEICKNILYLFVPFVNRHIYHIKSDVISTFNYRVTEANLTVTTSIDTDLYRLAEETLHVFQEKMNKLEPSWLHHATTNKNPYIDVIVGSNAEMNQLYHSLMYQLTPVWKGIFEKETTLLREILHKYIKERIELFKLTGVLPNGRKPISIQLHTLLHHPFGMRDYRQIVLSSPSVGDDIIINTNKPTTSFLKDLTNTIKHIGEYLVPWTALPKPFHMGGGTYDIRNVVSDGDHLLVSPKELKTYMELCDTLNKLSSNKERHSSLKKKMTSKWKSFLSPVIFMSSAMGLDTNIYGNSKNRITTTIGHHRNVGASKDKPIKEYLRELVMFPLSIKNPDVAMYKSRGQNGDVGGDKDEVEEWRERVYPRDISLDRFVTLMALSYLMRVMT